MRTFSNQFRDHERHLSNLGSRDKITYAARYDESGRLVLDEKGREDWYGYIQSHRDSVDIHVLLARFKNGEVDVLNRVQGFYGDITNMPGTFADALNLVRSSEEFFNSLPVEERAKYNHSFSEFLASFDSPANLARLFGVPDQLDKADDLSQPQPQPQPQPQSQEVSK
uniref:Internal scaffolding protein n=1 Tax=Dulem virus 131 TaxID=3145608 RepID=A0AAU8B5C2_9VIRU